MSRTIQALVARNPDKVEEWYRDQDGYWIELKWGWRRERHDTVHSVHADTVREVVRDFKLVTPCNCDDCRKHLGRK